MERGTEGVRTNSVQIPIFRGGFERSGNPPGEMLAFRFSNYFAKRQKNLPY